MKNNLQEAAVPAHSFLRFLNRLTPSFLKKKMETLASKAAFIKIMINAIEPHDWPTVIFRRRNLTRPPYVYTKDEGYLVNGIDFIHKLKMYRKEKVKGSFYRWEKNGKSFIGEYMHFTCMEPEYLSGLFEDIYAYPWKGKKVLDLGGYIGDSALFFLENGAAMVHVYEPVPLNLEAMQYNLENFKNRVSIYPIALSDQAGWMEMSSNENFASMGFGQVKGQYVLRCQTETIEEMLQKEKFDVVKVDIETGEKHLCLASSALLQTVPYWIIETHSPEIEMDISNTFLKAGFQIARKIQLNETVSLYHFRFEMK